MSELLGPLVVIGGVVAVVTAILAGTLWAIDRASARWDRAERDRMAALHYGRDELP